MHYAREGVDIHVVTATRGERGDLGTGDLIITRRDLPAVREAELRAVLALYGAHPPILLDYRDQELSTADFATLTHDVWRVMVTVQPEVVLTFGPTGISGHEDHITIHRAATEAFHRYRHMVVVTPRLYYVAIPPEVAAQFAFRVHPSEMTLSVCLDIAAVKPIKLQGLRLYRSQRDAQELAVLFASEQFNHEWFYQAYPILLPTASPARGLWHEVER
jgi:N-acetyl-1-D-myo-inositol-2-amino-2-deoxy-alpha-D-glucopyranoside deacetylase